MSALRERFERRLGPVDPVTGCQEWRGYRLPTGYGTLGVGSRSDGSRRSAYAHRVAYELASGPIPAGRWICHHCDNPPCCTPSHLFLGGAAENNADMHRKGRYATKHTGNWTPRSSGRQKLSADDVRAIRLRYLWEGSRVLARAFHIHRSTVLSIVSRRYRSEVPDDTKAVTCQQYLAAEGGTH